MPSSHRMIVLLGFLTLAWTQGAFAFDPFTAMAGAKAASNVMNGLDEAADIGVSLSEFLVEIDDDPSGEQQADAAVRKLQQVRSQINEAQFFKDEFADAMNMDDLEAKSHAEKIRKARRMIQMLKKVSALFGLRPKVAERASQAQQTQINYLMLEEMMAMRQAQFQARLDDRAREAQYRLLLEKLESEERQQQSSLRARYQSRRRTP